MPGHYLDPRWLLSFYSDCWSLRREMQPLNPFALSWADARAEVERRWGGKP
jgi:hypothetical protein